MKIINARGFKRLAGFMFLKRPAAGGECGLLIPNCRQIHTFFMRFSIDLFFLDKDMNTIKTVRGLKPWKISPFVHNAKFVLEVPAGLLFSPNLLHESHDSRPQIDN